LSLAEPYRSILKALLEALRKRFGDKLISLVVYGSVARGEFRRDSDLDILVIIEGLPKGRFKRQDLFMEVEKEVEPLIEDLWDEGYYVSISPLLRTPEEASRLTPIYLDMVEDAIILYDRGSFFENILNRLRKRLNELNAKRVRMGKMWYWVLKEPYEFGEVIEIE